MAYLNFILIILLSGCMPKPKPISDPYLMEKSIEKLSLASERIKQLKAAADIKGTGILGQFFHEKADVIAKDPHYLIFSLRSFFESPAFMIASNGQFITMYDFTGGRSHAYERIPVGPHSSIELFEFPFEPNILVNILLNKINLQNAQNIELKTSQSHIFAQADLPQGWQIQAQLDEEKLYFTELSYLNKQKKLSFKVIYSDVIQNLGHYYPTSLVIFAKGAKTSVKFALSFNHWEINSEPILPDAFYIKPH